MKVSIIIPVYNASLLIERCLNSVFMQKGGYNLEIICIDDGSVDNSVEIIRNLNNRIIIIQQSNQGPATARNKGIEVATGDYLTFLDADDYWKPEFLHETVTFLEEHPEAVAVNTAQLHRTLPRKPLTAHPRIIRKNPLRYKTPLLLEDFFSFFAKHKHVGTCSTTMRTDLVKKTGGQRVDLRVTEDWEFWFYLATFGKWGFIPHTSYVSDGGDVTKELGWFEKNRKRWASAPTIENWEKRIIGAISDKDKMSYYMARGLIARNQCYSMIMSNRIKLARKECKKYRSEFPKEKVALLMKIGSQNWFLWIIISKMIYFREYVRCITI